VIKIHEGVSWPQLGPKFIAGHELTRALHQHCQDFERLPNQLNSGSVFPQLMGMQIGLIGTKSQSL
jgi:hypothetical protein